MDIRKSITEEEMLAFLRGGQLQFPPLQFTDVQTGPTIATTSGATRLDALLTLRWGNQSYRFGVEIRRLGTPKAMTEGMQEVRRNADLAGVHPLLLVPYLSDERIQTLEAQRISGLDLCGNGIVVVPEELLVQRTGLPNQFRWEGTIKNVYRKNSSMVARAFLLVPQFDSIKEAREEIRQRGGEVTTATVSKVCKSLEDDLIIERGRGKEPVMRRLRLLQPGKLLDLLAENYEPPDIRQRFRGKCNLSSEALFNRFAQWQLKTDRRVIRTGASSVEAYAVMAREPVQSFYCTDLRSLLQKLGDEVRETDRFANVNFLETRDDPVYFDERPELLASPIQTYLELVNGDKREKETAEQVRRVILGPLAQAS